MSEVIEYKEVIDYTLLGEPITYLVETKRKSHTALGDKTPAQAAGIKFPYKNWTDVVKGGMGNVQ